MNLIEKLGLEKCRAIVDGAKKEPQISHLINHETLDVNEGNKWESDSGFLEYIDVLLSIKDIKNEIEILVSGK